jgi:hypothetical protein
MFAVENNNKKYKVLFILPLIEFGVFFSPCGPPCCNSAALRLFTAALSSLACSSRFVVIELDVDGDDNALDDGGGGVVLSTVSQLLVKDEQNALKPCC